MWGKTSRKASRTAEAAMLSEFETKKCNYKIRPTVLSIEMMTF